MGEGGVPKMEVTESTGVEAANSPPKIIQNNRTWESGLLLGAVLGVAITIVGVGLLLPVLSRQQTQQQVAEHKAAKLINPALTVTVAPVENSRVDLTLETTGTVAARDLIPILPQANGLQIKKIPEDVKEGSFVQKGQVLAILDDSILQTQINQAKADIVSDEADVISRRADVISKQALMAAEVAAVQQKKADLAQAQARLEEARKYYQRYHKLAKAGAISHQDLDTRYYTMKTAVDAVRLAQENVRGAIANVHSARANIGNARALVSKSQAVVHGGVAKAQQLNTQLGQTLVRAPVAGIVAEKLARVGDVTGTPPQTQLGTSIGGAQKLFSIIKDGKLELQAQLPEMELPQVHFGDGVEITSALNQQVHLQGRVREIQPLVNDKSREATVKIDLPPTPLLKVGMFAQGKITVKTAEGTLIPQKSLRSQADGSVVVFTLVDGELNAGQKANLRKVHAQKVEVGELVKGDKAVIKSGLHLNDHVVVDGAGYLKDGDYVQVTS
jgi:RND family efflux transporter MFP subunit